MSARLARVRAAPAAAGVAAKIPTMPEGARTAAEAAAAVGCDSGRIAKSLLLAGPDGKVRPFLTPGGRPVDPAAAARLAGTPLARAHAAGVRRLTGLAAGGVASVGGLGPLPARADPRHLDFAEVWAAAATPRHVFAPPPEVPIRLAGAPPAAFWR